MESKYILFTSQFGYNIFIADSEITKGIEITDDKNESLVFDKETDNPEIKLNYWSALTGYKLQILDIS